MSVLALGLLLLAGAHLDAHHYFAARYDASRIVVLKGAVSRVEWTNPHSHIFLNVKGATGFVTWVCEGGSPGTLAHEGLPREALKIGDELTIDGYQARDGSSAAVMLHIVLPNGRTISTSLADR